MFDVGRSMFGGIERIFLEMGFKVRMDGMDAEEMRRREGDRQGARLTGDGKLVLMGWVGVKRLLDLEVAG